MEFRPHEYQQRAIDFILDHPAAGLFLDMGLGKTVITLTAVRELIYERFEISKVLVIAPLRVAWDTWTREADKWDHLQNLRISRVLGSAADREAALSESADVYVINRENVSWLVGHWADKKERWPFDMIVIDELSSFKSSTSKRFKDLRRVRPMADRIVGLTGTPAGNGLLDLWAEIYLLDRGERLGRSITGYRNTYFTPGWSNNGIVYKWNARPEALQAITSQISDITMSMKSADYLQLPPVIESTISVTMDARTEAAYREMERTSVFEIEDEEATALNAAAVVSKLLQISNGFAYADTYNDKERKAIHLHDLKLEALKEIIEQADGPVMVFYRYLADKDRMLKEIRGARALMDNDDISDWNSGRIPVLLAHPASVGYGLNLQDGGHTIVWYGLTWSLEEYQQANARLHRQGQKKPVLLYHLVTKGTVDEQVLSRLRGKDQTQSMLIDILKERKRKYDCHDQGVDALR